MIAVQRSVILYLLASPPGVPGAIADCSATAGNTSIDLAWTAPSNHLSPITEYEVQYGTVASGNFGTIFTDDAVPGASITGLTNGTAYQFRVVAKNSLGTGPVSNVVNATPTQITSPTWTGTVGLTVDGNSITKNTATGWGNSGTASQESFTGDGGVGFEAAQANRYLVGGLSSSNTDAVYKSIEYAILPYSNGSLHVYEKGVDKGSFGSYLVGDRFSVERTGSTINYKKNNVLFYTSLTPTDAALLADFAIYSNGGKISEITISMDKDGDGYTSAQGDCDDSNPAINPDAQEVCDSVDNNCNGLIDEGVKITYYADTDGDGYGDPTTAIQDCSAPSGYVIDNTDCNDIDPDEHPGQTWYKDDDGDGYGDLNTTTQDCSQPSDYVIDNTDCDDSNAGINPGHSDIPGNGIDEDCDGTEPPLVTITDPATFTTVGTSSVTVTGTITPDANVTVTVNGVNAPVSNGAFTVPGITLTEGGNIITATAIDSADNVSTAHATIYFDSTPPNINISSPVDGFVATSSPMTVTGSIFDIVKGTVNENNATVQVNGVAASVSNKTFLVEDLPLVEGNNVITATASDQAGNTDSTSINITLDLTADKKIEMLSGSNQTGEINSQLPGPLLVLLTGADGNPAPNETVIFKVTQNNGRISGNSGTASSLAEVTDANGIAFVSHTLGSTSGVGNNKVEATAVGFTGTVVCTASATEKPPHKINIGSGNNQRGAVNTPLPNPLVAVVTDDGHNVLKGVPVTFAVTGGGGNINSSQSVVVNTDSDGRATVSFALGPVDGQDNNQVQADFAGNTTGAVVFRGSGLAIGDPGDTKISGLVLDNSNIPIPGVTVRVKDTTRQGVTDDEGQFLIDSVPVRPLHLIVDGSTVISSDIYPVLTFEIDTVAGQNNTLGKPIYLLPLNRANAQQLDGDMDEDVVYRLENVPGFSLSVKANSVTFPNGKKDGAISVTQVHADKMPMEPPNGLQPRFIITIQPPGAVFDPPAPITIPNVDGLAPGDITEMYSFDHDLGQFVSIGTGTVSEDGMVISSDPGFGVIKAGWHCGGNPQTSGCCAHCNKCQVLVNPPCECSPIQDCDYCKGADCSGCQGPDCETCKGANCEGCEGPDCETCKGSHCEECGGEDCETCEGEDCPKCEEELCKECRDGKKYNKPDGPIPGQECKECKNGVVTNKPDTDNDGVCDDLDQCEGFDDKNDEDGDGIPDGCDDVCREISGVRTFGPLRLTLLGTVQSGSQDDEGFCAYSASADVTMSMSGIYHESVSLEGVTVSWKEKADGTFKEVGVSWAGTESLQFGVVQASIIGAGLQVGSSGNLSGSLTFRVVQIGDVSIGGIAVLKQGLKGTFTYTYNSQSNFSGNWDFSGIRDFMVQLKKGNSVIGKITATNLDINGRIHNARFTATTPGTYQTNNFTATLEQLDLGMDFDIANTTINLRNGTGSVRLSNINDISGDITLGLNFLNGIITPTVTLNNVTAFGSTVSGTLSANINSNTFDIGKIIGINISAQHNDFDQAFANVGFVVENGGLTSFNVGSLDARYKNGIAFSLRNASFDSVQKKLVFGSVNVSVAGNQLNVTELSISANGTPTIGSLSGNVNNSPVTASLNAVFMNNRFEGAFDGKLAGNAEITGKFVVGSASAGFNYFYGMLGVSGNGIPIASTGIKIVSLSGEFGYNWSASRTAGSTSGMEALNRHTIGGSIGISDIANLLLLESGFYLNLGSEPSIDLAMTAATPANPPHIFYGTTNINYVLGSTSIYGTLISNINVPPDSGDAIRLASGEITFGINNGNFWTVRSTTPANGQIFNSIDVTASINHFGSPLSNLGAASGAITGTVDFHKDIFFKFPSDFDPTKICSKLGEGFGVQGDLKLDLTGALDASFNALGITGTVQVAASGSSYVSLRLPCILCQSNCVKYIDSTYRGTLTAEKQGNQTRLHGTVFFDVPGQSPESSNFDVKF